MSRRFPPELRWSLPAVLLVVGAAAVFVGFQLDRSRFTGLALEQARERAVLTAARTAADVERALRLGQPHEARDAVDIARVDRRLEVALLLDVAGRVLFATDYDLEGQWLVQSPHVGVLPLAEAAIGERGYSPHELVRGDRLWLAMPVRLRAEIAARGPADVGALLLAFDLSPTLAEGRALALRRTQEVALLFLVLVVVVWILLRQWVTVRARRLLASTRAIAAGDFSTRARLSGGDELARLSRSVDRMAAALGETTSELADRERWFRQLIEHGSDVLLVVDRAGAVGYASPSVSRVLGRAPEDLRGANVGGLVDAGDAARFAAILERAFAGGDEGEREEIRFLHADGRRRVLEIAAYSSPELLADGECVLNARDLTDWRTLEDRLRQAQKMEAVGRLAGGVAHDFNNLLTVILGHTELLASRFAAESEPAAELSEIRRAAQRAAELTKQLLAFGRRQMLQPTVLDLDQVVRGLEAMLRRLIDARIELVLDLAPRPLRVRADRAQLETAIVNLVLNGRDAMPAGGRLTIASQPIEIDAARAAELGVPAGRSAVLRVADTGVGMPPEVRERVFEPFFTTKEVGQGTGLGLSAVLGIVEQSGGTVRVTSEVGVGTIFEVILPRVGADGGPPPADEVAEPQPAEARPATVLVAEDEAAIRRLLETALGARGYRVLAAETPAQALELAAAEPVDLLVTDVVMPGRTGPELAAELRRRIPDLRVIVITGYSEEAVREEIGRAVDATVLAKPFTIERLAVAIAEELARQPAGGG